MYFLMYLVFYVDALVLVLVDVIGFVLIDVLVVVLVQVLIMLKHLFVSLLNKILSM